MTTQIVGAVESLEDNGIPIGAAGKDTQTAAQPIAEPGEVTLVAQSVPGSHRVERSKSVRIPIREDEVEGRRAVLSER